MGIGGLLPLLKEVQKACHVKDWAGKRVAVDSYVWLHRGAYGCAEDLALGRPTTKYVNYAMHRARMLKFYGVTPVMVFDGGLLPSKMGTEDEREKRRADALAKGNAFRAEGKGAQARECYVKAVDVTPAMAYQLIKALKAEGIEFVVAPYEADPQLAYLERSGYVDAIITEDSDLLVFGCRNVIFKLDGEGVGTLICRDDFAKCREYNLAGWSDAEFRHMAILSGCDYLDSVVGLGLKTAYKLLRKYKTPEKVIQFVRLEGNLNVPRSYLDDFRRAELTFLHQHVFDPRTQSLTHLSPLPAGKTVLDLPFIGPLLEADFAKGIANGEIDPITKQKMVDLVPDFAPTAPSTTRQAPTASKVQTPSRKGGAAAASTSGSGTILSFFSRQAAPPTSVNPVKLAKANARVSLVDTKKENVPLRAIEEPKRVSKFFGGSGPKGQERAARELEVVRPECSYDCDTVPDISRKDDAEHSEQRNDNSGDTEAEAALREIELCVELRSQIVTSPITPPAQGVVTPDDFDQGVTDQVEPLPGKVQNEERSASPFASDEGTPALATPSPTRDRHSSRCDELSEDGGISSPACSTSAQAGWPTAADESADILSSPVIANARSPPLLEPKAEPIVKVETRSAHPPLPSLSSDPIILSSDAPSEHQTPRPPKRSPRPPKARKSSPLSSRGKAKSGPVRESRAASVAIWEDTPRAKPSAHVERPSSGRSKAKKQTALQEETEGASEAVKAVAASWRAKFMLPAASKTPQQNLKRLDKLPPTPQTVPDAKAPAVQSRPAIKASAGATSAIRLPLSPRSVNPMTKRSSSLLIEKSCKDPRADHASPPPKKRRTISALDVTSALSSDALQSLSSSSPVTVTNPRLLAFKFSGFVRRDSPA
ncbi:hypothetical protein JCM10908_004624 [Rhodotorula pacifica]|uniref:uncharacterized protein n=1 Tax=Rhodotorula pacifica TaxID=1495444 RepID=UPI0031703D1B